MQVTEYNKEYLTNSKSNAARQIIEYDVGFNQGIQVNTMGTEVFTHNIGRDVDEMIEAMSKVVTAEKVYNTLEEMYKNELSPTVKADIKLKMDVAEKAVSLLKDAFQKQFEHGMTKIQGYIDNTNLAVTNVGSRGKRLELIETSLMTQKTNFKTLASDNEEIDITEVAILLSSAELSYEAALKSTGKVLQTSLLQFI